MQKELDDAADYSIWDLRSLLERQRETIQQQENHSIKTEGSSLVKKVAGVSDGDIPDIDKDGPANQPSPDSESRQNNTETLAKVPKGTRSFFAILVLLTDGEYWTRL